MDAVTATLFFSLKNSVIDARGILTRVLSTGVLEGGEATRVREAIERLGDAYSHVNALQRRLGHG